MSDQTDQPQPPDAELSAEALADIEDALAAVDAAELSAAEEAVELDVQALLVERDSFKDIALRLQADFDNYRKRVANQQADEVQRATGKLAEALLPVLDACEAAFVQHPAEIEPIFNLMLGSLKKLGLDDSPKLMEGINAVIETYGKSERNKQRAVVYYMLAKHFGKESVYK